MVKQPSDFSFDTYPGLDADLEAAYERNVTLGTAEPSEEIASSGLAAAVQSTLEQNVPANTRELATEIGVWASPELNAALTQWNQYNNIAFDMLAPPKVELLASTNPNFPATMNRLHRAKHALFMGGEVTPESLNVGDTMHLVIVPWQTMKENLGNFKEWLQAMRAKQGLTGNSNDFINDNLLAAIQQDKPLYRKPGSPSELLTPTQYLDGKISADGPWGVFLAQTSNQAGVNSFKGHSPDAMTGNGGQHLIVNGETVDMMGIFEWIALTLQEDPTQLSTTDYSWLLANRLTLDNGGARVPSGYFYDGRVGSRLRGAGNAGDLGRVRLAVA